MEPLFRNLRADEIECRVAQVSEKNGECKGVSLLLYKDARCDMAILDETVSASRWQRKHYECKGNLFCSVGIFFEDDTFNGWVWKDDCGSESNTEKEKGEASDSFKRACFNWGIGRELYTAPFIWIPAGCFSVSSSNGKIKVKDRFFVRSIKIENKRIVALEIANEKTGETVFAWESKQLNKVTDTHVNALRELLNQKGVKESAILKRYKLSDLAEMTMTDFIQCCEGLNEMEDKA